MKPLDFEYLQKLLRDRSGLVLSAEKLYLVESRLTPVAQRHGMGGLGDLIQAMRIGGDEALLVEVTDAMTTNESFFFRDIQPFETLRNAVLPEICEKRRAQGKKKIRIWSAACSSGQEPYTIAMLLKEDVQKFGAFDFEIVATDLSTQILDKAKTGLYSQFEVQRGLPIQLLVKYFKQEGEHWQIDAKIRDAVKFMMFNLLEEYKALGTFDVIFCRNVLIYFDQATKSDILRRMADRLPNDGVLYLGGAESVLGVSDSFKPTPGMRGVYGLTQTVDAPAAKPAAARA